MNRSIYILPLRCENGHVYDGFLVGDDGPIEPGMCEKCGARSIEYIPPQSDGHKALTWTTDKPEKSGWYWYRENNNAQVAFIEFGPSGHGIAEFCEDCRESLFLLNGEWAGPLEVPE